MREVQLSPSLVQFCLKLEAMKIECNILRHQKKTTKTPPAVCPCTTGEVHVRIILVGVKTAKNVFLQLYRQNRLQMPERVLYYAADGKNDEQNVCTADIIYLKSKEEIL